MIILSFDISKKATGYAAGEKETEESGSFPCKNLIDAEKSFTMLIRKWKPNLISWAKPTRYYSAIRAQARVEGVLMLCIEKYNSVAKTKIKVIDSLVDSQAKKAILGSGKASKHEVCEYFGRMDEDEADSELFLHYTMKHL